MQYHTNGLAYFNFSFISGEELRYSIIQSCMYGKPPYGFYKPSFTGKMPVCEGYLLEIKRYYNEISYEWSGIIVLESFYTLDNDDFEKILSEELNSYMENFLSYANKFMTFNVAFSEKNYVKYHFL